MPPVQPHVVLKVYNVIGDEVAALADRRRKQAQSGRYKHPDDQGKMWFGLFSSLGSFCLQWVAASAAYIRVSTHPPGVKKMILMT
jgi:hypothetical protein